MSTESESIASLSVLLITTSASSGGPWLNCVEVVGGLHFMGCVESWLPGCAKSCEPGLDVQDFTLLVLTAG